jgi:hypothetical protein
MAKMPNENAVSTAELVDLLLRYIVAETEIRAHGAILRQRMANAGIGPDAIVFRVPLAPPNG